MVVHWNKAKDKLPEKPGRYLCCYTVKGYSDFLYNVFEFNVNAQEFQFGYVGVVVTHWMEIPEVEKFDAVVEMVAEDNKECVW